MEVSPSVETSLVAMSAVDDFYGISAEMTTSGLFRVNRFVNSSYPRRRHIPNEAIYNFYAVCVTHIIRLRFAHNTLTNLSLR